MQLDAGTRIGKYEVGKKLGQGGFGVLYTARDTELDRDIAIKILRPEHVFKPQVVQRFLQEARAAARIQHPGIVTVFESGAVTGTNTLADGTAYIAMELLAGDTLAQRIKQNGRLPTGIAIGFCRQMAAALAAAHAANIVHRDLKPQNVFLVRDPAVVGGERVKVLDFGIAKLADSFGANVQTHSLVMLGTPMYMSPEQCKSSAKVDARSDIYTLGCILFEMLCGRTPFDGDSGELIAKHQLVPPPTAKSIMADLPDDLDKLISSMLAKSADERPQTMAAVIDVLDAIEERIAPAPELARDSAPLRDIANMTTIASVERNDSFISKMTSRRGIAAIVGLAILCGIIGAAVGMRSDDDNKEVVAAHPEDNGSNALAITPVDAPTAEPVRAPAPAPAPTDVSSLEVDQLVIECRRLAVESKWRECKECARLVATRDEARGAEVTAVCKPEARREAVTAVVPSADSTVAPPANCDPEASKEKGMANINMGQHAAALQQFEASLRCKDDAYVRQLAFMEACASSNSAKAKQYYVQLTPGQQEKFAQICQRQKPPVAYKPGPRDTAPATCDATAPKEKGMEAIKMGQHAAALAGFEASLRCKDDDYVRQLAFAESCASGNSDKAKYYYKKLTLPQQTKFAQICIRQKPPVAYK